MSCQSRACMRRADELSPLRVVQMYVVVCRCCEVTCGRCNLQGAVHQTSERRLGPLPKCAAGRKPRKLSGE